MKKIVLKNVTLANKKFERLDVLLNHDGSIALLPTLFSIFCYSRSLSLTMRQVRAETLDKEIFQQTDIQEKSITLSTCMAYVTRVFDFMKYCDCLKIRQVDTHTNNRMNQYLNDELGSRVTSIATLQLAKSALASYRVFLFKLGIADSPTLHLHSQIIAAVNSSKIIHSSSDYVSRDERTAVKEACKNDRDRLIVRCGYELGLRSSELRALMLTNQKIKGAMKPGLLFLFEQLQNSHKDVFLYTLNGIYTKYKKSRDLYIPRSLLIDFRSYYQSERQEFLEKYGCEDPDWLFIRYDPNGRSKQLSERHGTNVFGAALRASNLSDKTLSFHKLRHTFATEYFANLIKGEQRSHYSQSNALFLVAKRLGHAKSGTTERYIRLIEDMNIKENIHF